MPVRPSLIDTMRQDMAPKVDTCDTAPMSPERASTPTIGFLYDYTTDEPPTIQRIAEAPTHASLHPDPPKLRARPGPALLTPRPRSTSVPPTPTTVKIMAKRFMPVTEQLTPPISPARVAETDPATPLPIYRPGKERGHGKWRAQLIETTDVGARRQTTETETPAMQAQASRASWPEQSDQSLQITRLARNLQLRDPPEDRFTDIQRTLTTYKIDENQNEVRPPAAGIHSHQQNVYFIPPPRAGGGVVGASTPVSMVPLGLIHHVDPLLAAQLREDPASLAVRDTRLRVLSTFRLMRTGTGTLSPVQSDLTYQHNCLQELLAQSIRYYNWNTYLNCSVILLDMPHYCGLNILTIFCLVDNCVAPYFAPCSFITVIVSYLGLGQPPLQLRLITFNTLFISVYITSLVLLPSAARIMHFCKFYCHYHYCYTYINITGCNLKCSYQILMWYYIVVYVQTFLFYIITQRDIYRSLL